MNLSKSRYCRGIQCPKMLWMERRMPEQFDDSVVNDAVLQTGSDVGDLAMGYYGEFVEVPFDANDFDDMEAATHELIGAGTPVICEATFSHEGSLCMVDILRVDSDGGVHVVEVKSSSFVNDIYYHDMAFQTWVLTQCGMDVKSVSLMHLNNKYVRHGALDLHELFVVEDCSEKVFAMLPAVGETVASFKAVAEEEDEPIVHYGDQCKKPYPCGYRAWCWRDVPSPSVFDLPRIRMKKALELESKGIVTLPDAVAAKVKLTPRQAVQARCEAENLSESIDRAAVAKFVDGLAFPLWFLDFETFQPAVPPYDGTWPFQQIPTQYSLHVLRAPDAPLEHYEFLAQAGADPRRAVAEHLAADIPAEQDEEGAWFVPGTVLAYNMGFEKSRINEMAQAFPDLSERLLAINASLDDLIKPFSSGAYYARSMGGSDSIKRVLPALFPDEASLDYHALNGVHNGSEASAAFADLAALPDEEAARVRENLLRYCELDTFAMVKIWQKLAEAARG